MIGVVIVVSIVVGALFGLLTSALCVAAKRGDCCNQDCNQGRTCPLREDPHG